MAAGDRLSEKGRFAPLVEGHPGVGEVCQKCGRTLKVGDRPALIEVGPASPKDEDKASRGAAYTAEALIVHESCAYPDTHGEDAEQLTEAQKAEVLERARERFATFGATRKRRFRR